jgi:two-component system sensor histidine kinase YesM
MTLSIRAKLMTMYILIILLTGGLIGTTTYINWAKTSENDAVQLSRQVLTSKKNYLEAYINERFRSIQDIWFNVDVKTFIAETEFDPLLHNRIQDMFASGIYIKPDLEAVILFNTSGKVIFFSPDKVLRRMVESDLSFSLPDDTLPHVISPHSQTYFFNGNKVFSILRGITVEGKTTPHNYLMMDINLDVIDDLLDDSLQEHGYFFVTDIQGDYIFHPFYEVGTRGQLDYQDLIVGNQGDFFTEINGKRMLVTYVKGEYSNWTYFGVIPQSDLIENIKVNRNYTFIIMIICFIVVIILSFHMSYRFTRPLIDLQRSISKAKLGDFSNHIQVKSKDEIGFLSDHFNKMLRELDRVTKEVYLTRMSQTEAELKHLQSQINPHFLYNALDSIRAMAELEGVKPIEHMATNLSKLFRFSIKSDERLITVKRELEYVQIYLDIQFLRFGNRFRAYVTCDKEVENQQIIKFILQPLVENAYTHGLEPKEGKGSLWISVICTDGGIQIRVSDDGVGMTNDNLRSIQEMLKFARKSDRFYMDNVYNSRIGLLNVHQRLLLHYGEGYEMVIKSYEREGTSIEINLNNINE